MPSRTRRSPPHARACDRGLVQAGALVAEGCERVFQEKASGRSTMGGTQLEKAIAALGSATSWSKSFSALLPVVPWSTFSTSRTWT